MRILLAGFQHETNTFAASRADDAAFAHGGGFPPFSTGEAVRAAMGPAVNLPAAGFLAAAAAAGDSVTPILWCAACPSGFVARATYERIATAIVAGVRDGLAADPPAEALYLDLHGAMVAEHVPDGEGELLARIRAVTGPEFPIVVSLDLHGNISARFLELADAATAFRTYPHVDMAETGRRAHALLAARVARGAPFPRAWTRAPYMTPICWQSTDAEPARGLYARLATLEAAAGSGAAASVTMGFPAADIADCGALTWAYGATQAEADALAAALHGAVVAAEAEFTGPLHDAAGAVTEALRLNAAGHRPVVIADAQDNPGAGGSSDTTGLLRALVAAGAPDAILGLLHDPAAAAAAHAAGPGAVLRLALGGRAGLPGDMPFETEVTVEAVSDGRLRTSGPYFGVLDMDVGLAACLRIGGVRIAVASNIVQMADMEMFRFLGLEPVTSDIVVVKSAIHFRAHFAPVAAEVLTAVAPGAMMMRATDWAWKALPGWMRLMPGGPTADEARTAAE
ncbi:M81 family metallopeptidase [Frigidibacter sp. MR17.14]|uniref:M81 family metallopeptidase n=1 Tax=Frigidibacter sp. MR17.14 TaxID=3126509 RepID=UPI0030131A2B